MYMDTDSKSQKMLSRYRVFNKKGTICVVFFSGLIIHVIVTYINPITSATFEDFKEHSSLLPEELKTHEPNNIDEHLPSEFNNAGNEQRPKKILIWNTYWESRALWNKIFAQIIHGNCPIKNCILTMNKLELNSSDAILFHLVDLHNNYEVPKYRNSNQIWIAMTYEPPFILNHTGLQLMALNGIFNRTMSYRKDSDIVVRHGKYHPILDGDPKYTFPNYISNWVNSRDDSKVRNYAQGKRRLVSWFASSRSCKSHSGREFYVKQLQEYIDVDIYGSCGPFKCGVQKTLRNPYKVEHDDCYFLVSVGYKFVLAFENSICEDYVTEKLYNNLKLNVIPVVFGGSNYSYYAPPHSVIDASKLTPKELAEYLVLLDKNDTLYNEYFNWKKDYYIESNDGVPLACDLCRKLNDPLWSRETKVYNEFDTWIGSKCKMGYREGQEKPLVPASL